MSICSHSSTTHWETFKSFLRYLEGTMEFGLLLKKHEKENLVFHGFANSDWTSNLDDWWFCNGYCIFLEPNLISWSFRKQSAVSWSSIEVEYNSLTNITVEVCWLTQLAKELRLQLRAPMIWYDDLSTAALAYNIVLHTCTKYIETDIHFVKVKVLNKEMKIWHVSITKALEETRFTYDWS